MPNWQVLERLPWVFTSGVCPDQSVPLLIITKYSECRLWWVHMSSDGFTSALFPLV